MPDDVRPRLERLLRERLHAAVPSVDADLLESGLIDSLQFVTLLADIEREFDVEIPLAELDFDRVKSVAAIAELVRELSGPPDAPRIRNAVHWR